jgi:glycosyltransferase involved in cell wall biosynthesis
MLPLVSINIPVFKCEDYIIRCLDSVKNQTYQNLEIILINDCTPDNSVALIEQYIQQNPEMNIFLYHNEINQGLSVVRNKGIDNSSGKYIYMLDSDDYISSDCIEKLVAVSEKENSDITVGETICLDSKDGKEKMYFPIRTDKYVLEGNEYIFERFIYSDWPIIAPNKLYNRQWINENNLRFVKGLFSQDELWAFHCSFKLNKIAFIKDITYVYYLHGASTIFNRKKINFENYQTILEYFHQGYNESDQKKKDLLKIKITEFREMVMIMQWKAMRDDLGYFMENYTRMKRLPSLNLLDYLNSKFSWEIKKLSILQNLPTSIGTKLFIKRFGN